MITVGRLLDDVRHAFSVPADQPTDSHPVILEPGRRAVRQVIRIEAIFRDVDSVCSLRHLIQSYACHSEPVPERPFRSHGKDGSDHTSARPRPAHMHPIQPPPSPGRKAVLAGGFLFSGNRENHKTSVSSQDRQRQALTNDFATGSLGFKGRDCPGGQTFARQIWIIGHRTEADLARARTLAAKQT